LHHHVLSIGPLVATVFSMTLGLTACGDPDRADAEVGPEDTTADTSLDGSPTDTNPGETDASQDTTVDAASDTLPDARPPHTAFVNGLLEVDGEPVFLFGGDLHYFRVRAESYDPRATEERWLQSLNLMRAAGMNVVSTYAAWDYHQLGPDTWDFYGARDLGRFLDLACSLDFHVILKPGPLITGEWPKGFGTFGAVPAWWKAAHPDSLAKKADGTPFNYSPTGDETQVQPSYLDPTYLADVREWYRRVLEIARPHLGGCLVGLQIDNETNLYWGGHYGDVDYSESAIAFYREWLREKYGFIGALNQRYRLNYPSFEDVDPPTAPPSTLIEGDRRDNTWYADWYWAGQAMAQEYLRRLRAMMEEEGFREPDVFFLTNDSPFPLMLDDVVLKKVLMHDGPTKNEVALCAMDLYPKQFPSNSDLQDQPFQADFHTRLYDRWGDMTTGPSEWVFATELQGGFYKYPDPLGSPAVLPEATEQLLARTIGRGLKGGIFYVIRDGWNGDGSAYEYQAAIDESGRTTARYDVMARWGAMLKRHGRALLDAREVTDPVAVLVDGRHAAPRTGVLDDTQRLFAIENPAIFGWLQNAGVNPAVIDARNATLAELARYRVVYFQNPDFVPADTAKLLTDYVAGGGMLVNLLWPGRLDEDFRPSPETDALAALFVADEEDLWPWLNLSRSGLDDASFGDYDGPLRSYWYETTWSNLPQGAVPFLWELSGGDRGDVIGWVAGLDGLGDGQRRRAFIGANVFAKFNQHGYYSHDEAELRAAADLARWLTGLGGVEGAVQTGGVRELAWVRRVGADGPLYVFVVNDRIRATTVPLRLGTSPDGVARLGLAPGVRYEVADVLADPVADVPLGTFTQAELAAGIPIDVARLGVRLLVVRRAE